MLGSLVQNYKENAFGSLKKFFSLRLGMTIHERERERLCNIEGNLTEDRLWSVRSDMFLADRTSCCYMGLGTVCFLSSIRAVMYKYPAIPSVAYTGELPAS